MDDHAFMEDLLALIPYWKYAVSRPLERYNKQIPKGLSLENYYIVQIVRWFDGLSMTEIATRIRCTKQQVTVKVDKLCQAGYLQRRQEASDRRMVKVYVTDKGVAVSDACRGSMDSFAAELRQVLPQEDMPQLHSAIKQMLCILPKLDEQDFLRMGEKGKRYL